MKRFAEVEATTDIDSPMLSVRYRYTSSALRQALAKMRIVHDIVTDLDTENVLNLRLSPRSCRTRFQPRAPDMSSGLQKWLDPLGSILFFVCRVNSCHFSMPSNRMGSLPHVPRLYLKNHTNDLLSVGAILGVSRVKWTCIGYHIPVTQDECLIDGREPAHGPR